MKYIEKFASLVPAIQGNKVLRRVEEMRATGEIQTEAEYNAALQKLLSNISTTEFKPAFEFVPFQAQLSSSEHFNMMMDLVRDDLEVLFIELNNIFATIKAHDLLFRDKLIDELYFVLKELEDKTEELAIIGDIGNSFDNVFLNTFNGQSSLLDKNNQFANEILFDPRKEETIPEDETVFIDSQEKVATLPLSNQADVLFKDAGVRTGETTVSEVDIQLEDADIKNMLDPDSTSGWAYNILSTEVLKEGARLSLELDFGDKREINFLVLHPISDFPVFLEKIQYVNINNNTVDLPGLSFSNQVIDNPIRISFPDVIAKKIVLVLSQTSSVLLDYDKNKAGVTFDDLKRGKDVRQNAAILTTNIKENIQDPEVIALIPLASENGENFDVYNQYVFAFKRLFSGLSQYKDDGYLVSSANNKKKVGIIGLDAEEENPFVFNNETEQDETQGSFEYSIVKKDYNAAKDVIQTKEFPILPVNASSVTKERLHFNNNKRVVPLRFIGHTSSGDGSGVVIYRNDVELIRGTDWRFFDRNNQLDNSDPTIPSSADSTRIEILQASDIVRRGKYTASYVPRHVAEPNGVHTFDGVTYLPNNVTEHPVKKDIEDIEESDLFLKAIIRNNSESSNLTPKIKSYKILTSTVDKNKHVRV